MATDKKRLVEHYGGLATSNMKESDIDNFVHFILLNSSCADGVGIYKQSTNCYSSFDANQFKPDDSVHSVVGYSIPKNWRDMSEAAKFRLLTDKFGADTVISEWLRTMPTVKLIIDEIRTLSLNDAVAILNEFESDDY